MKFSKRYTVFIIILVLTLFVKFNTITETNVDIAEFRGGDLSGQVWSRLVAEDVNNSLLTALIDNHEFNNAKVEIYMDNDRNIMVPVSLLRDALNCSVHIYNEQTLVVEKHEYSVRLTPTEINGAYYISLEDLSELLGYNYNFDIASKTVTTQDTSDSTTVVPTRYDLREKYRVSSVKDQGSYGTCWAFAAIGALESTLLPEETMLFSVDHMTMSNSFNSNQYDGGEYTMGMAYLAAWQGPVYEQDDPYGDGETNSELTAVKHVQEMQVIEGKNYDAIKTAVLKYGGVQSSIYSTLTSRSGSAECYDNKEYTYCYIGTERPNHDILIIGWDDNFPKEKFPGNIEGDGAFICLNSWGSRFGENGVFYISYYDSNIGTHNVAYTRIDDVDNYDNIYQSDLCGWVGQMGYEQESLYGANAFTAGSDQELVAAGFYATGTQTKYKVYVVNNFEDDASFVRMQQVASGQVAQAGYYTVDFDKSISLSEGERYAVVIYVETPGSSHPLAIEYDTGDFNLTTVDLSDGEGYISYNGTKFVDVKTKKDCNLCIKAYTNNR